MDIIALLGFKGSGKDTVGQYLIENHGYVAFSFAESLKDTLAAVFCWDRALLEGDTLESRIWRETVDEYWAEKLGWPGFTPRIAMQQVGTDVFREHFNRNIWIYNIDCKLTKLKRERPNAKIVLRDARFPNELQLGRTHGNPKQGGSFRSVWVQRDDPPIWWNTAEQANGFFQTHNGFYTEIDQSTVENARIHMNDVVKVHESEWAWIGQKIDIELSNRSTFDALYKNIETVL
jgi:hypothetical protein